MRQAHVSRFITRQLEQADAGFDAAQFAVELHEFAADWMTLDGVFVLRLLAMHTSFLFCAQLVDAMWRQFLGERAVRLITAVQRAEHIGQSAVAAATTPARHSPKLIRMGSINSLPTNSTRARFY